MILANYHTHTTYCDGKNEPEAYTEAAEAKGFAAIGFSTHAPAPGQEDWTLDSDAVSEYFPRIEGLKQLYKGRLEVYSGLEVDYIPGIMGPSSSHIRSYHLDYTIGSVHIMQIPGTEEFPSIDGPVEEFQLIVDRVFNGSIRGCVEHFFELNRRLLSEHTFNILGHMDLIKIRNRGEKFYSESDTWYRDAVISTLETLARTDTILEINTGGISRGKSDSFYPSLWILEEARRLDIPVIISTDSHSADTIDAMYTDAAEELKRAGYTHQKSLLGGTWQDTPL